MSSDSFRSYEYDTCCQGYHSRDDYGSFGAFTSSALGVMGALLLYLLARNDRWWGTTGVGGGTVGVGRSKRGK